MRIKLLSICGCLIILLSSLTTHAKDTIQWQSIHFPPLIILKGPDKGQGQLDHFMPYLQNKLSQYQHDSVEMNWARTFKMIKKGENICSNMVFKTPERELIAEFSVPVAIALPFRIIMSKANISLLGNPKTYPLAKLIRDKRFYGNLVNDRSYTPVIDKLLKQYEGATNFDRKAIVSKSLITMLKLNRVDYMIEYPSTVSYLTKNDSDFKERFGSLAIEEIPSLAVTYLACPKNKWGEKVIDSINKVVIDKHASDEYINLISRYYNPAEREVIREGLSSSIIITKQVP